MDSCWKNTPPEIVQLILRFACTRLVYRDGKYIEIGKVKNDFDNVNNFIIRNLDIRQRINRNIYGQWYFQFSFSNVLTQYENDYIINHSHGLCYDFNYHTPDTFQIWYWSTRCDETNYPYSLLGTRIITIIT